MNDFIGFAGVGGAIIASMGLAMWMEWYCLRWLMRIMPGKAGASQSNQAAMEMDEQVASVASEPEPAEAKLPAASPAKARRYEVRLGI
jgi:hypothetical protein